MPTIKMTPLDQDDPKSADSSTSDAVPSASESIADKLRAYSRDLEPQMRARSERKKDEAALAALKNPPADSSSSSVNWANSNALSLSPNAAIPATAPSANAAVSLAKPAVALTAPLQPNDVPQIVPEGEDFDKQTGAVPTLPDSDSLMQQLAGKVHENPHDLAAQTDYQMLAMVRGDQVPDLKSLAGLSAEDRETEMALMDGLSNFRNSLRNDSNPMLSQKVRPLVEMADRLKSESDLDLPAAAVCSRVDAFGKYEPMNTRFISGREHPVILYCEVANFASTVNDQKEYETRLSNEATLYDQTGMVAWQEKSPTVIDKCRNRRHDFFLTRKTKLPAIQPIGRYVLKISVTDQQSNRVAEITLPVEYIAATQ